MKVPLSKQVPWKPDDIEDPKLRKYLKNLVLFIQSMYSALAELANQTADNALRTDDLASNGGTIPEVYTPGDDLGRIHIFDASSVTALFTNVGGGPYDTDVSAYVPTSAKAAILKVIVNSYTVGSGSFVVSDRFGNFASPYHFYQNGITNYSGKWVGGIVIAPFYTGKTFRWKTASNVSDPDSNVKAYAGIIGFTE